MNIRIFHQRRGGISIEPCCSMCLLILAIAFAVGLAYRTTDVFLTMGVADFFGEIAHIVLVLIAFVAVVLYWIGTVYIIFRLRVRVWKLLFFPLLVGIPLGFAIIPYKDISLHVYCCFAILSILVMPILLFLLQFPVLLQFRRWDVRERHPLPDSLPQISEETKAKRILPMKIVCYDDVTVHLFLAREAFLYDGNIEGFRENLSTHSRKYLERLKRLPSIRSLFSYNLTIDGLLEPYAAPDFEVAHHWAEFVRMVLPSDSHKFALHDELLFRAICAAILDDQEELLRLNDMLQRPLRLLDRVLIREPRFWTLFIDGLALKDRDRCTQAIRVQSEEWFRPSLIEHYRLNVVGLAMTNFCRHRGIDVLALEPIVPETLCLKRESMQEGKI